MVELKRQASTRSYGLCRRKSNRTFCSTPGNVVSMIDNRTVCAADARATDRSAARLVAASAAGTRSARTTLIAAYLDICGANGERLLHVDVPADLMGEHIPTFRAAMIENSVNMD